MATTDEWFQRLKTVIPQEEAARKYAAEFSKNYFPIVSAPAPPQPFDDEHASGPYDEAYLTSLSVITDDQLREMHVAISHRGIIKKLFADIRREQVAEATHIAPKTEVSKHSHHSTQEEANDTHPDAVTIMNARNNIGALSATDLGEFADSIFLGRAPAEEDNHGGESTTVGTAPATSHPLEADGTSVFSPNAPPEDAPIANARFKNTIRQTMKKLNAVSTVLDLHKEVAKPTGSDPNTPRSDNGDELPPDPDYGVLKRKVFKSEHTNLRWVSLYGDRASQHVFMQEMLELRNEFGVPKKFIERAFKDDGPMPFFLQQNSHAVLLMRIPSTEDDAEYGTSIKTISNRVVMLFRNDDRGEPPVVITYHRNTNHGMSEMQALWSGNMELNTSSVSSTAKEILQRLLTLFRDSIDQLEDRSETAEASGRLELVVEKLSLVQKQASVYARCLESLKDVLKASRSYAGFDSFADELIEVAAGQHTRSMELAENANTTINLRMALDSYRSGLNMKYFTYLSIVCQPIAVCTGWYGMNFENMPELPYENSYFIFCGGILFLVITICCLLWWSERIRAQIEASQDRKKGIEFEESESDTSSIPIIVAGKSMLARSSSAGKLRERNYSVRPSIVKGSSTTTPRGTL